MMLPGPPQSFPWHFIPFVYVLWLAPVFFHPNLHGFLSHKSCTASPCGSSPSCAASITRGPVLPVLRYARARSMYAPLEMTDGVDSCWQALNMHTQKRTRAHAHCPVQTLTVCLAHTNSTQEMTDPPATLKRQPSSLDRLAGILVEITDCIQRWTGSLWRQQLFSQCHSWVFERLAHFKIWLFHICLYGWYWRWALILPWGGVPQHLPTWRYALTLG